MARGVQDNKIPDRVTLRKDNIRNNPWRPGTEVHGKAVNIIDKPPGIGLVDGDLCLAHVRDLFEPGRVVEVTMGEDNGLNLLLVRGNRHRHDARVHEDVSHYIGVRPRIAAVQPLDLHAQ